MVWALGQDGPADRTLPPLDTPGQTHLSAAEALSLQRAFATQAE